MVLGFEPVDKPIIPRRSFFDKGDFLALTGMFSLEKAADRHGRLPRYLYSANMCREAGEDTLPTVLPSACCLMAHSFYSLSDETD